MTKSTRLDQAIVERGLADTRSRAKALIMAGDVLVNDQKETRAGRNVGDQDVVALREQPRFVSRGGEKLDKALDSFGIDVSGYIAADLGSSTGGFTDCLLQRGAAKVYAVDVGYGILDERMRTDPRVVSMERTNARHLETLPEPIDIVVIDVSFISLSLMFPVVKRILKPGALCVPLIKPQFEAGKDNVGKRGVVRDPAVHEMVLRNVLGFTRDAGMDMRQIVASSLRGPNGNIEFLAHIINAPAEEPMDEDSLVAAALSEAAALP
jgi:23S rRNA (cytidine1920-2'-O)/16S rRNA (cytidine1409-2'-O)-methyltransferase